MYKDKEIVYKVKNTITKNFKPSGIPDCLMYTVTIPKGLRCTLITEGSTKGKFFLNEFPPSIFPFQSIIRHDAIHYGIVLELFEVEEIA
jgi:hypothetical protein